MIKFGLLILDSASIQVRYIFQRLGSPNLPNHFFWNDGCSSYEIESKSTTRK
jgi:hypothetical protein